MNRAVSLATLNELRHLQHGGVEQAKALARVVKRLDEETAGMAARELRQHLLTRHGLDLREDKINRSRYIARLLYALDPEGGNPEALTGIDDAETLYLLQRLHEVKGTPHAELLHALAQYHGQHTTADIRQRMKDAVARAQNRATSQSRATWRQPLMRVPGETCDTFNKRFATFTAAQGLTQQQAVEAVTELLVQPTVLMPFDLSEQFNRTLTTHFERLGIPFEQGISELCALLDHLPDVHWHNLYSAVRP